MSTKILLALAAMTLFASCSGPGNWDGSDTDGGTGQINVHAVYDGASIISNVMDEDGNILGLTDEIIPGLEPGVLNFNLGHPSKWTLNGVPYHIENDEYLLGGGSVSVTEDEVASSEAELQLGAMYACSYTDCSVPYEDGACNGAVNQVPSQWIYMNADNVLHGSEHDAFGDVGGEMIALLDPGSGVFTVTSEDTNLTITEEHFDLNTLRFSYVVMDSSIAVNIECSYE